jgi:hypothetical protein
VGIAEDLLGVGEGALEQRDRLGQPPDCLVGGREVVTGSQDVGVSVTKDPLAVGEGALEQLDGLVQLPGCLVGGRLGASLEQFAGNPAYGIQHLRDDLDRFIFLLGGSDGEQFLTGGHDQNGEETRRQLTGRLSNYRPTVPQSG